MIEIYTYDIRNLLNKDEYETRLANASSYRREKINKSGSLDKAKEHLASAAVIDEAVRKFGLREKNLEYGFGAAGKPYIKSMDGHTGEEIHNSIHFNISHSGDYVVCAVSDREVGIDIQKVEEPKLQVAKRFFTPKEYEYISNHPDDQSVAEAFYRIWTLKESFVKAIGVGTNLAFNTFEFEISKQGVNLNRFEDDVQKLAVGIDKFQKQDFVFEELKLSQTHVIGKCEDELYKLAFCEWRQSEDFGV